MANTFITISVPNIDGIRGSSFFSEFWKIVASKKANAEKQISKLLLGSAKYGGHRSKGGKHFQTQTGGLEDAVRMYGSLDIQGNAPVNYGIEVDMSMGANEYVYYVINPNGNTTWDGDPFINEAMDYNRPAITAILNKLYNDSIKEFNRRP